MSLIRLENISKSFAGAPVLEGIDFRVEEGEHIGLIGRNGTGKSTIFRIITGEIDPDGGVVERRRRMRFACLNQLRKVEDQATIYEIVLGAFEGLVAQEQALQRLEQHMAVGDEAVLAEYSRLQDEFALQGGYTFRTEINRVLRGLGFTSGEFDLPFEALSGGQRTRLMLALVLLQEADLLLLDEPENHLDLEAREWLEEFLKECPKAVVVISHDRQMLNTVVSRIVEVEQGALFGHTGNYEAFVKQKALLREQQRKAFERQQDFVRKQSAWIERFRYKNTKARQVQSRIKRLEKMEMVDAPPPEMSEARFRMGEVVRSGAVVLDARDLTMAFGDLKLYDGVSLQVQRGERVGLVGPNGSGKTTLLRQIAGTLQGLRGTVTLGHKVELALYEQHHESLNTAHDVFTEIQSVKPEWTPLEVRSFLGRFLFSGDEVFKPVAALSGGELSRVAIAKLILSGANLLLVDEPTNHLDIASREALESALTEFPGTLVVASHDRAFIDLLVDKLVVLENGRASVHLGNYAHYRWKQREEQAEKERAPDEGLTIRPGKAAREQKRTQERRDRRQRRELEEVEANIEDMEALLTDYDARFASLDPSDYEQSQALKAEYEALKADLEALYKAWEELAG